MQFDISKIVSKLTIFTSMPIRPFGERCLLICLQGAFLAPSMPPSYGTNFSGCCLDHAVDDIASENVSKVLFQLQICLQANCGPVYHTVDDIGSQDASKVPFQLQKCLQKCLQGAFLAPKNSPSLLFLLESRFFNLRWQLHCGPDSTKYASNEVHTQLQMCLQATVVTVTLLRSSRSRPPCVSITLWMIFAPKMSPRCLFSSKNVSKLTIFIGEPTLQALAVTALRSRLHQI